MASSSSDSDTQSYSLDDSDGSDRDDNVPYVTEPLKKLFHMKNKPGQKPLKTLQRIDKLHQDCAILSSGEYIGENGITGGMNYRTIDIINIMNSPEKHLDFDIPCEKVTNCAGAGQQHWDKNALLALCSWVETDFLEGCNIEYQWDFIDVKGDVGEVYTRQAQGLLFVRSGKKHIMKYKAAQKRYDIDELFQLLEVSSDEIRNKFSNSIREGVAIVPTHVQHGDKKLVNPIITSLVESGRIKPSDLKYNTKGNGDKLAKFLKNTVSIDETLYQEGVDLFKKVIDNIVRLKKMNRIRVRLRVRIDSEKMTYFKQKMESEEMEDKNSETYRFFNRVPQFTFFVNTKFMTSRSFGTNMMHGQNNHHMMMHGYQNPNMMAPMGSGHANMMTLAPVYQQQSGGMQTMTSDTSGKFGDLFKSRGKKKKEKEREKLKEEKKFYHPTNHSSGSTWNGQHQQQPQQVNGHFGYPPNYVHPQGYVHPSQYTNNWAPQNQQDRPVY